MFFVGDGFFGYTATKASQRRGTGEHFVAASHIGHILSQGTACNCAFNFYSEPVRSVQLGTIVHSTGNLFPLSVCRRHYFSQDTGEAKPDALYRSSGYLCYRPGFVYRRSVAGCKRVTGARYVGRD